MHDCLHALTFDVSHSQAAASAAASQEADMVALRLSAEGIDIKSIRTAGALERARLEVDQAAAAMAVLKEKLAQVHTVIFYLSIIFYHCIQLCTPRGFILGYDEFCSARTIPLPW